MHSRHLGVSSPPGAADIGAAEQQREGPRRHAARRRGRGGAAAAKRKAHLALRDPRDHFGQNLRAACEHGITRTHGSGQRVGAGWRPANRPRCKNSRVI